MREKRITLALGAGGPVGHAFHAGLLRALADVLAWDPRDAHLVLGTSAGAQVGALLRAGMSAKDLAARVSGEALSPAGALIARHYTRPRHDAPPPRGPRPYRPASAALLQKALARPWALRPGRVVTALLPEGHVCLKPQAAGFRAIFGERWPEQKLWITAVCLHSGERTAFGREGAPVTDVGTAVACSGAVPSVCAPVEVNGRYFVDGGVASATHLDLLHDTDCDVVIVSSPLSMIAPMRIFLWAEVRKLRAAGKRVIVVEPTAEARAAMGLNPMDLARSPEVARVTYTTMLRELARRSDLRELF